MSDRPEIRVREAGAGRPALVLHGGPGPDGVTALVDHLAQTHHVIAPVHPGWAGTSRPAGLDSVPRLATAYRRLLEERGIEDLLVVGTSFGGWVAAELAAQLAEAAGVVTVDPLVLIDSIGAHVDGVELRAPQPPAPPAGAARGSAPAAPAPSAAGPTGRGPDPTAMAALAAYTSGGLTDPGLLPRLAAAAPRTLLIWGEQDQVAPLSYGRAVADRLPAAAFTAIPGAGHVPYRDAPDAVFDALDGFFTRQR